MNKENLDLFFDRTGYYFWLLAGFALAGFIGYLLLPTHLKKRESVYLSVGILILVAFYELIGSILSTLSTVNNWVYNIFSSHLAAVLFLLLIRSFLIRKSHKNLVILFIGLFLLISLILHLIGFVHYNDAGEYISLINTVFIICSCSLYFYELITLDEFLAVNPLKEYSFWATTAILFYFSSSFMIYISLKYLYTHHLDIYYMVMEIPRSMTLLCNFLLCFAILSEHLKNKFQLDSIHV